MRLSLIFIALSLRNLPLSKERFELIQLKVMYIHFCINDKTLIAAQKCVYESYSFVTDLIALCKHQIKFNRSQTWLWKWPEFLNRIYLWKRISNKQTWILLKRLCAVGLLHNIPATRLHAARQSSNFRQGMLKYCTICSLPTFTTTVCNKEVNHLSDSKYNTATIVYSLN